MSRESEDKLTPVRPIWSDGPSRDALQLIAEGVTDLAGFGVAAISVAREDGKLEVAAVAGSDEARIELQGRRTPIDTLMAEIEKADHWGLLRFVPHERLDPSAGETWGWIPDVTPIDDPDAWHPLDLLIAPLTDEHGVLRGTLAIDLPVNGKRPDEAQRRVLQTYAEQAGRAVITALEREALAEKVRLAEAARKIVRTASAQLSLDSVLADCQQALVEGFQAHGMWIQTFDEDGHGTGAIYSSDGSLVSLPDELVGHRRERRPPSLGDPAGRGRRLRPAVRRHDHPRAGRPDPAPSWPASASRRSCSRRWAPGPSASATWC